MVLGLYGQAIAEKDMHTRLPRDAHRTAGGFDCDMTFLRLGVIGMKNLFNRFVREEAGQDLIEYGLLVGIITVAAITAITTIGPTVGGYFTNLNANLP
jgi:pilus assembly protein Flp/PilA